MDKRSPKSPVLYERYKSGCAWGLIGFCNFSQGHSNKKLISNRGLNSNVIDDRHVKNKLDLLSNSEEKCQCVDDGKADIMRIREEEMDNEQRKKKKISTGRVKHVLSDSQSVGHLAKNHRRNSSKMFQMHGCKDISTVVHTQPSYENSVGTSSERFNVAASTEKSCNQVHPKRERDFSCRTVNSQKNDQHGEINLQVQMNEAAEAFINQKFGNGKDSGRDQASHQSKHFLDAVEILNSNKELFVKLLQDPNSLVVKQMQDFRDSQAKEYETRSVSETKLSETSRSSAGEYEEPASTQKSCDIYPSKGSVDPQPSNKIVVLKSSPTCKQTSAGELSDCSSPQSLYSLRNGGQGAKPVYVSFERMKRKLRHAIGLSRKEKTLSSTVIEHKSSRDIQGLGDGSKGNDLEIVGSNSTCKIYPGIVGMGKPSNDVKRRDKAGKARGSESSTRQEVALNSGSGHESSKLSTVRHLNQSESNIYIDSRKHLWEVLRNRDEVLLRNRLPKSLGRIISLPENDFLSTLSPGRHQEHGFVAGQMRFSPYSNYQMVDEKRERLQKDNRNTRSSPKRQIVEAPSLANNKLLTEQLQTFDTEPSIFENQFSDIKMYESVSSPNHALSPTGSLKIVDTYNIIDMGDISSPRVPLETNYPHNTSVDQSASMANKFEQNQYLESLKLDSPWENCTLPSPKDVYSSSTLSVKSLEDFDDIKDKAEHPSPVSVLGQFVEDITSPPSTMSQLGQLSAEPAVEPKQINFEEPYYAALMMSPVDLKINSSNVMNEHKSMSKYIRTLLQASDINWDELVVKCPSSDQLLEPSLFDEMEVLPTEPCGDHRLLFDYINEVLGEVYQSYFSCSPWVSFAKQKIQPIQATKNMVYGVMKCIDWHLLLQQHSLTLEQLVQRDLAKSITWMDIQIDTGDIVTEMVESLLEELALETAINLNI